MKWAFRKKPTTMNEMLKELRDFFERDSGSDKDTYGRSNERRQLLNVLSLLRGPDDTGFEAQRLKGATTAVIRTKVFGLATDSYWQTTYVDTIDNVLTRRGASEKKGISSHFICHAIDAFNALGLRWDMQNEGLSWQEKD